MKALIIVFTLFFALAGCKDSQNGSSEVIENPPGNVFGGAGDCSVTQTEPAMNEGEGSTHLSCSASFNLEGLCFDSSWLIGPNTDIGNSLLISFNDTKGVMAAPTREVGAVAVLLEDDNGPQNVRQPLEVVQVVDSQGNPKIGQYKAINIDFTQGFWEVRVQLFENNVLVEEHGLLDSPFVVR